MQELKRCKVTTIWQFSPSSRSQIKKCAKILISNLTSGRPEDGPIIWELWHCKNMESALCCDCVLNRKSRQEPQLDESLLHIGPESGHLFKILISSLISGPWQDGPLKWEVWSSTYAEIIICFQCDLNFRSQKLLRLGKSFLQIGPESGNMSKLPKTRKLDPTWWGYCEPTTHPQTFMFSVFGLCLTNC